MNETINITGNWQFTFISQDDRVIHHEWFDDKRAAKECLDYFLEHSNLAYGKIDDEGYVWGAWRRIGRENVKIAHLEIKQQESENHE
jgi:hypothetical protein